MRKLRPKSLFVRLYPSIWPYKALETQSSAASREKMTLTCVQKAGDLWQYVSPASVSPLPRAVSACHPGAFAEATPPTTRSRKGGRKSIRTCLKTGTEVHSSAGSSPEGPAVLRLAAPALRISRCSLRLLPEMNEYWTSMREAHPSLSRSRSAQKN